jgi:WD40 repeat protein
VIAEVPDHPDSDRLREFARGALGDDELERIAEHLQRCDTCLTAVDGLLAADGFLDRLRSARTLSGESQESEVERWEAARALRRRLGRSSRSSQDGTAEGQSPPHEVGEYEVFREVGRGGMGVVYQARHRGLRRPVALKMILTGVFSSETQRQRFRREAELAARVQHPNIVQVYEVGLHDGRPFLAMEWVAGGTLADRLGTDPWPADAAARLAETLARAIDVAHRNGVVHRDLKPSNILLQHDSDGDPSAALVGVVPKVADFGLARSIEDDSRLTSTGVAVGTPEYMAPEQARTGAEPGPAADIYALGAVLYQLLTGQPPFRGESPIEVLQALASTEPVAPRRFRPRLPRDLETIALKAIEKEPARRYATAGAMAEDLRRFLAGEPILARPPTAWERLAKWARRRPALAGLTAALTGVTVLALAGITALWVEAAAARDRAKEATAEAVLRGDVARRASYRAAVAAAAAALELHNLDAARAFLEAAPEEHRNWEWRHVAAQLDNAQTLFRPAAGPVASFALAPAGDRLAYAVAGGRQVRLWAPGSRDDLAVFPEQEGKVTSIAFDPDGSRVAAGSSDGRTRVWDVKSGRPVAVLDGLRCDVIRLSFGWHGSRLLCSYREGNARLWDVADGRCLSSFPVYMAQFSPDGRCLLVTSDYKAQLRDAITGDALEDLDLNLPESAVTATAMSPDGRHVATGLAYPANEVRLWDRARPGPPAVLAGHKNSVIWLTFSPDGRQLASYSMDRVLRLWDTSAHKSVAALPGHGLDVCAGTFSPDGRRLVMAGWDRAARIWDTLGGELLGILRCHAQRVSNPVVSRDGSVVAMADENGVVSLWNVDLAIRRGLLLGHESYVYDVTFSPDGRTVASAAWDGTVRLWDAETGRETASLRDRQLINTAVVFSPDGRRIASVARPGQIRVWESASRRLLWTAERNTGADNPVGCRVAFSPRGATLAVTGDKDGVVRLFEDATGKPAGRLEGHRTETSDAAFSPTGTRLATADREGTIRLWDVGSRTPLAAIKAHDELIYRIAFSPDGRTIASASQDSSVRLHDAETLEEVASWRHGGAVYGLAFSPDGTRLASACRDSTVRLLDVATRSEVAELRGHLDYVHAVAFSPDGTRLVSGSGDYRVRVWDSLAPNQRHRSSAGPAGR